MQKMNALVISELFKYNSVIITTKSFALEISYPYWNKPMKSSKFDLCLRSSSSANDHTYLCVAIYFADVINWCQIIQKTN